MGRMICYMRKHARYLGAFIIATCVANVGSSRLMAQESDTLLMIMGITANIDNELSSPSSTEIPVGTFLTYSQQSVRKCVFDLAALGTAYGDTIYSLTATYSDKTRSALLIALGLMGDPRAHSEIRAMAMDGDDLNIRTLATLALGKYDDTTDVALLIKALHDSARVIVQLDFATPSGDFFDITYPVRGAANNALVDMGYGISKDPVSGELIVKKRKK